MKKIRLRSHKKIKLSTKISCIIIVLIICTYLLVDYSGKKVMPVIMNQAKIDCKKMAIVTIKNSLNDDVLSILDDEMYNVIQNKNGEIQTIDFNPVIVNRFLSKTTSIVSDNLRKLEKGEIDDISFINSDNYDVKNLKNGVISEVPMGIITNNVLLSNLGPKIPVKINLIGNVVSSVETKVRNYGINSALIEIYANVEVTEEVIIPFQTERIKITNNIPVAIKIINGSVPDYYSDGTFYLGVSGSGKSVAMKNTIANVALSTNDDIIIIDAEREYAPIARALGGEVIEISPNSQHHINPLDLQDGYEDGENPIAMKSELITSILEQQMGAGLLSGISEIHHRPMHGQCLPELFPRKRRAAYAAFVRLARRSACNSQTPKRVKSRWRPSLSRRAA